MSNYTDFTNFTCEDYEMVIDDYLTTMMNGTTDYENNNDNDNSTNNIDFSNVTEILYEFDFFDEDEYDALNCSDYVLLYYDFTNSTTDNDDNFTDSLYAENDENATTTVT